MAKKKQKRNISGLRNQPKPPPTTNKLLDKEIHTTKFDGSLGMPAPCLPPVPADHANEAEGESPGARLTTGSAEDIECKDRLDSESSDAKEEECSNKVADDRDDLEKGSLYVPNLKRVAKDEDWTPQSSRQRRAPKKARPSTYIKGPDVASKSERTQSRYAKLIRNQSKLDVFGFKPVGSEG